jgi:hypothetical protein
MILAVLSLAIAVGGAPVLARGAPPAPNPAPIRCADAIYRVAGGKTDTCPPVVLMRGGDRKASPHRDA